MKSQRRPFFELVRILHDKEIALARKVVSDSARTLRENPVPDIFLGRKTHEPFPKAEVVGDRKIRR